MGDGKHELITINMLYSLTTISYYTPTFILHPYLPITATSPHYQGYRGSFVPYQTIQKRMSSYCAAVLVYFKGDKQVCTLYMFPTVIQAWILPAHVSVKASIFLGGSPKSFGQVCAAQGLKPWPFLRIRQTKSDTLFKAQNLKNNTQFKESHVSEHLPLECQPKMIALFKDGDRQNPTPSSGTYQSSPYRSTPPPLPPAPGLLYKSKQGFRFCQFIFFGDYQS